MSFNDLQSFLTHLEKQGDLKRVKMEVDPELEITEIAQRIVREDGPALLFERVQGSRYPLAINILGGMRRIEMALAQHPAKLGEELVQTIERLNPPSLKNLWRSRRQVRRLIAMRKVRVRRSISQACSAIAVRIPLRP